MNSFIFVDTQLIYIKKGGPKTRKVKIFKIWGALALQASPAWAARL